MLDHASFRSSHPELSDREKIRVPGLTTCRGLTGEEVESWEEAYRKLLEEVSWEDSFPARSLMKEHGAEAFGSYLSFRLEPERWGLYLKRRPLMGLAQEILRVLGLGYMELKERVPINQARELAFRMAFDIASNHLSFHASVDSFAASREVEDSVEYYGSYLQGPYMKSLRDSEGPLGYNLEEALANVVALRSFLNPNMTVEMGSLVQSCFNEEEQFRWNAYLMSGNLTTEVSYIMRVYPPGYRNFTEFFRRRGEVGPYAHMAVQYDLDSEAFNRALDRLANILLKGKEFEHAHKEIPKPVPVKMYLVFED